MSETMEYDVVIVGGGPAGLAAAIRLRQRAPDLSVCVIEKGSEIGAHILSGAVIEPRALDELLPDWRERCGIDLTEAREDRFLLLTRTRSLRLPTPRQMHNHGNIIVSLGDVCRFLAREAEALGVEIYAGFAGAAPIYEQDRLVGVCTGAMGVEADGGHGANYQPGMELRAACTLLAEGCRGSLTRQVMARYDLRRGVAPQTYALGIKELWEVPAAQARPGLIEHSVGWPLDRATYGGSWLYHFGRNLVSYGFVVGLDYADTYLSPFEEMQRCKLHPAIKRHLRGGRRLSYGARALSEGGLQSLPKLVFPGGAIIGDAAGFLNVPKIKGTHAAMKSGMLAADAILDSQAASGGIDADAYPALFAGSWLHEELYRARNIRPGFAKFGFWGGIANAALDTYVLAGRAPWTLPHARADHETLKPASRGRKIAYPRPDGVLTFDRLSSVYVSNTNHAERQPAHLVVQSRARWEQVNLGVYDSPESRYCPAAVYEVMETDGAPSLRINAQNCVHCKTCDIKDPTENIVWRVPQGGDGPNYPTGM